jgi:UrcA family protein
MLYPFTSKTRTSARRATRIFKVACIASLYVSGVSNMLAQPAYATTGDEVRTKIVRYGDLNLASTQGQQVLEQRIRRAAKQVCDMGGIVSIVQHRKIRLCAEAAHNKAWTIAQQRIGNYRLAVRAQR